MKSETLENNPHFLSTLPPGPKERAGLRAVIAASALLFFVLLPFAKVPMPHNPGFIPVYETLLVVIDLITAVLLFGQYQILRSRALLCLACGYLFAAFMEVGHALSFPYAFSGQGMIGGGPQTTAWIYLFWHAGFPLFVIGYALFQGTIEQASRRGFAGVVGVLAVALALVQLAASGVGLPVLIVDNVTNVTLTAAVIGIWALCFGALLLLWNKRPLATLDLWLMVVMWAWLFDVGLSALLDRKSVV